MIKKSFLVASLVGVVMVSGVGFSQEKNKMYLSKESAEVSIRKLTLTLGQSAHDVKMDAALNDLINEEAFIKGVSAYMNQPFDFTYKQDSLSFNVARTHTIQLYSIKKKLSAIDIDLYPLFEDDFDGALQLATLWDKFFTGLGLIKKNRQSYVPLDSLKQKFSSISAVRCGFNTGAWIKDGSQFSLGIERFEREVFNTDTKETIRKPVYKVSLTIKKAS